MKIVDTRGEKCPKPIIETRKALKDSSIGETFQVLTDNKTSHSNISRFLSDNKISFSVSEKQGVFTFVITNEKGDVNLTRAEEYCETIESKPEASRFAVAVSSEFMGQGDDELGKRLMKSFFVALSVLDDMPSIIAFYNSGVKLAVKGSDVLDLLQEIEKKGVELILCGTCVDYYKLADKIEAGKIADMFYILQKLSLAGNVVRP
jgi:selenium metabolism protein YedF